MQKKTYTPDFLTHEKKYNHGEEAFICLRDHHAPIVSREVFERAQVISNHMPNTDETFGILNYALFSKMRYGATFINTARGAQVAEDDIAKVLAEREDLTALLDVTYPEPPESDNPLITLPNCVVTPHIAGSAGDECGKMGEYIAREFLMYQKGGATNSEVSLDMLKNMA